MKLDRSGKGGPATRQRGVHKARRLELAGELDLAAVDQLATAIEGVIVDERATEPTIDLDQVNFLDSSGIGALMAGHHLAVAHGTTYRVVNPHGVVRRVLEITGMLDTLVGAVR